MLRIFGHECAFAPAQVNDAVLWICSWVLFPVEAGEKRHKQLARAFGIGVLQLSYQAQWTVRIDFRRNCRSNCLFDAIRIRAVPTQLRHGVFPC